MSYPSDDPLLLTDPCPLGEAPRRKAEDLQGTPWGFCTSFGLRRDASSSSHSSDGGDGFRNGLNHRLPVAAAEQSHINPGTVPSNQNAPTVDGRNL